MMDFRRCEPVFSGASRRGLFRGQDFCRQELLDKICPAMDAELFRHHAQGGIRSDEVDGLNAIIATDRQQELLEKDGTAGARGRDGQILWRMTRQWASDGSASRSSRSWSIGIEER